MDTLAHTLCAKTSAALSYKPLCVCLTTGFFGLRQDLQHVESAPLKVVAAVIC